MALWGSSGQNVFSVCTRGMVVQLFGDLISTFTDSPFADAHSYLGIWGSGQYDIFVCGWDGVILHADELGWAQQDSGNQEDINAVFGLAPDRVFAVGDNGWILHYDGTAWSSSETDVETDLNDVWALSETSVYAAGGRDGTSTGTIIRFDGQNWREDMNAKADNLMSICGRQNGDIFAVGAVRDDEGKAHPVVWKQKSGSWTRVRYDGVDAYLWSCWCSFQDECFAMGTGNVFFEI